MEIKFYEYIEATPEEIFLALTNPFTIELWSDSPAKMDANEGTEFELWDGDICGRNLKVVTNQELVQEWYFDEQPEPSIATIKLHPHKTGTQVEVKHTNVPDEAFKNINDGWHDAYIGAIKRFFEEDL
ncbi:MAG TPA: ATPase [Marinilabiliales bacterium]|nr:MAG: ATPase [Bacteroidetes bacterium GWA2_40_14]OFX63298.1 MAG: ATPase [Bacteroidetes bacterium GWC2_40_13]OFX74606.1 MAG: ATPase [Bacteroidetes bacterium GWD2_40_43]OFX88970.1 MAG: ATPase [Bacteroidetes bacterium GWE2_40_63]OFY22776.1 MAG: ATPase [Bacteroidetes bacterium GWF2_40_13]OFZ32124.1 MAG: ATPase [Bacteroidetes bacterium RIFOXYC2_FULL_40_12]HAM98818.1 ATPase [Marinilabiliales bacterium]